MEKLNMLLQISAKLFEHLSVSPKSDNRDEYINTINYMLDKRGAIIEELMNDGFRFDEQNHIHRTLLELDNGIKKRLAAVMDAVKQDMANLQKTKKSEQQYFNPYSNVRVMDGMYYDKKN